MKKYLILQHPGHNRVYYKVAGELALAELKLASQGLETICDVIEIVEIKSIRYLSLTARDALSEPDLQLLSRLSFVFAIFEELELNSEPCLIPIAKGEYEYVDTKISSLLKYAGKTNELFTKMMINVAMLSSDFDYTNKIRLLDPVAGKGTTLFEGIIYGFDVTGIEIDAKATHATEIFFKKYLEEERFKHIASKRQIYGKNIPAPVNAQTFEYARDKEEFKDPASRKKLEIITGNSKNVADYFKKETFHLIVGDLPYGIAHGNLVDKKAASITRNPSELLSQCLPQWHQALKTGGVVVIAWNAFVVAKRKLEEIFVENGFEVLNEPPYDNFEHLVDRSIRRDILVAKKK